MSSASYYQRLRNFVESIEFSNLTGALIPIHHWHADVCNDQTINVLSRNVRVFYLFKCLKAIVGSINYFTKFFNSKSINCKQHGDYVKRFIINDEDPLFHNSIIILIIMTFLNYAFELIFIFTYNIGIFLLERLHVLLN